MIESLAARGEAIVSRDVEEIYRRRFDMVYRICFSYMKNPTDTEDMTADVFVKLMKRHIAFQSAEHEKAWLIRTAVNTCKDFHKSWWRRRANIDDYEHLQGAQVFVNETLEAVMELPARYKDVIYLYYYEGYTTKEIADILKRAHSTVRNHLREARILLKGVLEND